MVMLVARDPIEEPAAGTVEHRVEQLRAELHPRRRDLLQERESKSVFRIIDECVKIMSSPTLRA